MWCGLGVTPGLIHNCSRNCNRRVRVPYATGEIREGGAQWTLTRKSGDLPACGRLSARAGCTGWTELGAAMLCLTFA
jgi:hypothetical protein